MIDDSLAEFLDDYQRRILGDDSLTREQVLATLRRSSLIFALQAQKTDDQKTLELLLGENAKMELVTPEPRLLATSAGKPQESRVAVPKDLEGYTLENGAVCWQVNYAMVGEQDGVLDKTRANANIKRAIRSEFGVKYQQDYVLPEELLGGIFFTDPAQFNPGQLNGTGTKRYAIRARAIPESEHRKNAVQTLIRWAKNDSLPTIIMPKKSIYFPTEEEYNALVNGQRLPKRSKKKRK